MAKTKVRTDIADPGVRDDDICSMADVLAYFKFSRMTLWKLRDAGKFPDPLDIPELSVTLGRYLRWRVGDVRKYARDIGLMKDILPHDPTESLP